MVYTPPRYKRPHFPVQMSNYRRAYQTGGCYFFPVVTHARQPILTQAAIIERLREAFRRTMRAQPFELDAIVVLPDHLHCVWQLSEGDHDFSSRWRAIKHYASTGVVSPVNARGEKQIWQRRFWEHLIDDEQDWRRHIDYIHYNPVKHGYVAKPVDWPHSSFEKAVKAGWYDEHWGQQLPEMISGMEFE